MRVHTFHIPVLGLAFSIDTPMRIARFGISSVISLVDDILIEHVREKNSALHGEPFEPIGIGENDFRARRITAYLNLVQRVVDAQIAQIRCAAFEPGSEIVRYFEMLPDISVLKMLYRRMQQSTDPSARNQMQSDLRKRVVAGAIDVNIMTKLNKTNTGADHKTLPGEYSDALASLRGFARSALRSSVVFSAGMNPRLYSYLATLPEFLPDDHGRLAKKVILKVSDLRSALIQGKFLARKGVWVSEFRIESGLNCGGHAFATDGLLLGPILEEFKTKKNQLIQELHELYASGLQARGLKSPATPREVRITVQGGIGTRNEDQFLREYYELDGTGWGSPFLLVPDATNVDPETRNKLANGKREDFYLSDASPLGIPFNNFRGSSSEKELRRRIDDGRPGSPCTKKFLISNTEFTESPICTASRQYQALKIKQLDTLSLTTEEKAEKIEQVTTKSCLCEDLAAPARMTGESSAENSKPPVAVCPGPNLAYFSKISSLEDTVGHIYGRRQLLSVGDRPNMFINELRLYIDYLKREIVRQCDVAGAREQKYFDGFKSNLLAGIAYYKSLIPRMVEESEYYRDKMHTDLADLESEIREVMMPGAALCQNAY